MGGLHSAPVILHSVDFAPIAELQAQDDWEAAGDILGSAARGLAEVGAEFLVIATNTKHIVADQVEAAAGIPILHIELVLGVIRDESREEYRAIVQRLIDRGATGMIAGCTEITMQVGPAEVAVPLFDTTELHALAAGERALS